MRCLMTSRGDTHNFLYKSNTNRSIQSNGDFLGHSGIMVFVATRGLRDHEFDPENLRY